MNLPTARRTLTWPGITVPSGGWTDGNADGDADPGEATVYSLHIINTGTVSLHDIVVASDTIGAESIENFTLPESGLAPKERITLSATYKVHGWRSFYRSDYHVSNAWG